MAVFSALVRVFAVAAVAHASIYPEGHWERSAELTTENADRFVKEHVDAGKTVFAPSWNAVVEAFHGNPDVIFGDVALSKDQVREIHGVPQNPGAGGWPTIRYFNKQTGYGGGAYTKKTSMSVCDELGPKQEYMQQYVEEQGGTSLCNVHNTSQGCSEQQKQFVEKWSGKPAAERKEQLERLRAMAAKESGSLSPSAFKWLRQRVRILEQLGAREEL